MAVLAADDRVELDLAADTVDDVGEVDLDRDPDVAPGRRPARGAAAEAEQVREHRVGLAEYRLEDVLEAAGALRPRVEAAGAEPLVAERVVGPPAVSVGEDLVGLGGLLELLLGGGVGRVDVRVQLAGEAPERPLDLGLLGGAIDAEDLVRVAWHRRDQPS